MQGFFINDYDLSSVEAKNYVTHNMMEMIEREARDVEDSTDFLFKEIKSEYTWAIGSKIADAIFPTHPTRIFDFDVVYEPNYIFDANSINFLRKSYKNCINCRYGCDGHICPNIGRCFSNTLDSTPTYWKDMTKAQKLEKKMSNTKTNKKLVGDISSGYSYIDTDILYNIEELNKKYPIIDYNKMYIKKEDKKMDIKLYECGTFVGGVVTKPQDLIKNVIFSGPCTIVQWSDGDKTVVRCENEDFDKEKGLAMAIVKKFFGTNESKSNYNDIFKKWIQDDEDVDVTNAWNNLKDFMDKKFNIPKIHYYSVKTYSEKFRISESKVRKMCREGVLNAEKQYGSWIIGIEED